MTPKNKKRLTITLASLGSVVMFVLLVIALLINFVFTPSKLTPMVLGAAHKSLHANLTLKRVELTFFSTFPKFGLKVEEGTLVSKVHSDSSFSKQDSLLTFSQCVLTVNPFSYLINNKILIHNLKLTDASVYVYTDKEQRSNWDVAKVDTTELKEADNSAFDSSIDIRNVELIRANLIFDNRYTDIYGRIDEVDVKLKASLNQQHSALKLDFGSRNIVLWQQGELLVNHLNMAVKTDVEVNQVEHRWTFHDAQLTVNGVHFDAKGTVMRDALNQTLDMDINYGLHAPSMETVLAMLPQSIVKKAKVSAKGEVRVAGKLCGVLGNQQYPVAELSVDIKDASAKYDELPYGIDHLSTKFDAYIDIMRNQPSYLNLNTFHFIGAHTDVLADGRIDDLLTDPQISFHTLSAINLDSLALAFPLQQGVTLGGKLDADIKLNSKLSSLKKQDVGRIGLIGKLKLDDFVFCDSVNAFNFSSNASATFTGDKALLAEAQIGQLELTSRFLNSTVESLLLKATTTQPKDTTQLVSMQCSLSLSKLKANQGDSFSLFSGKTAATVSLQPGKKYPSEPLLGLNFRTDSLYVRMDETTMRMNAGDFDVKSERRRDSLWDTSGSIGFDSLFVKTPEFALPICVKDTRVTLHNKSISLIGAQMQVGNSALTARGYIHNISGAFLRNETMKANLAIQSDWIDCTELINSLVLPADSLVTQADTLSSSDMPLFVVPKNIDFELQTNIGKVTLNKMLFEQVYGTVDLKDQYIYLRNLEMIALGARMSTVAVYKASDLKRAYAGFDFRIKNINIGKLVEFIPALDTIVPMLRSFKGRVNFDIAAETRLDSTMSIIIPSLRSAMHLKGDSLVLMDGETFSQMSRMLMFKNKKENLVDSISVNITVDDGKVNVFPFLVEIDRYKAAVGGKQGLDLSFDYHISILKSPLPFKAGINITGTPDKVKFRIGKAKYKDAVTPINIQKIDSTRLTQGGRIVDRFKRITRGARQ